MKSILPRFIVCITVVCSTLSLVAQRKTGAGKRSAITSKPANMLTLLQGRWSSLDDKKTFFHIEGNRQIDIYGRDILDTATINFYNECPDKINAEDEQRKSGNYLTVELKPGDFYCYSVDKITSQQLVLTYLPKGSILRYRKVPAISLETYNTPEEH